MVKNTLATFAVENYEIASCKSLLALADTTGRAGAAAALKQSLGKDEVMAPRIDDRLAETTRMFVSRAEAGETAGR